MEKLGYENTLDISSWDQYYISNDDKESYQRLRLSDTPELTKKVRLNQNNTWTRIEIDVPLDMHRMNENLITEYVKLEGYSKARRIYKSCFIYWQHKINYVYYIVYNDDLEELGRFIEIEFNKNASSSEAEIKKELYKAEQFLLELGIEAKNRLKRSLFDLFIAE
jgi:adenylate cyclase class IV